jgi:hypothetical protein
MFQAIMIVVLVILALWTGSLWYAVEHIKDVTVAITLWLNGMLTITIFWMIFKAADILDDFREAKTHVKLQEANMKENQALIGQMFGNLGKAAMVQQRLLKTQGVTEGALPDPETLDLDNSLFGGYVELEDLED